MLRRKFFLFPHIIKWLFRNEGKVESMEEVENP
jgi:hypothetical protein